MSTQADLHGDTGYGRTPEGLRYCERGNHGTGDSVEPHVRTMYAGSQLRIGSQRCSRRDAWCYPP